MQSPTVGRTVLFVTESNEIRPATVVRVNPDSVNLSVHLDGLNDGAHTGHNNLWVGSAVHDQEEKKPGTWHWMPFQEKDGGLEARLSKLEAQIVAINDNQPRTQKTDLDAVKGV